MIDDPAVAQKRKQFNEAQNAFYGHPTPETKAAYKAASSALNLALHHAGKTSKNTDADSLEPDAKVLETGSSIPPEDAALIDAARLASNAAQRALYANPNEENREKWKAAKNEYQRVRRKLDPEFRAKLAEATRKSLAKKQ